MHKGVPLQPGELRGAAGLQRCPAGAEGLTQLPDTARSHLFVPDERCLFFAFHLPAKRRAPFRRGCKAQEQHEERAGCAAGHGGFVKCKLHRDRKVARLDAWAVFLRKDSCHSWVTEATQQKGPVGWAGHKAQKSVWKISSTFYGIE